MVGHGFGGPHASEDHLPGVAQSGAGAELGGGAQSSARPDELQLDRAGGNCSISGTGTLWHRHTVAQLRRTLSHPSLGPGEEGDWGEGHGKMKKNVLNS